jgi:hypothetical protein
LFFILFVVLLLAGVFFSLNSPTVLNKVATTAIKSSGLDVKYESLEGGLFDGLNIKGFNYEDKLKADLKLKADFKAIKSGLIHVEELNISNLWIDEKFLNSLTDSNSSKKDSSSKESFIKRIIVDKAFLNLVDFHYKEYEVSELNLKIDDLSYDMKEDIKAKIKADFKSSVADAMIKADIKDERYTLHLDGIPKKEYIESFVKEQNITIENSPHVLLDASGDFHKVDLNLSLNDTKLTFEDIDVSSKDLKLSALFDIDKKDLDATLKGVVDSSLADLDIKSEAKLNIEDINNTLYFTLKSDISPKEKLLSDQNLTVKKMPKLTLLSEGDFKLIKTKLHVGGGEFAYEDITIKPKTTDIDAEYSLKEGSLSAKVLSDVLSNVADFDLDAVVSLDVADINRSLKVDLLSHVDPKQRYLKTKLSEQNITIEKMPKFVVTLVGDYEKLDLKANLSKGAYRYQNIKITSKRSDIDASYSLLSKLLDAKVLADVSSDVADAKLDMTLLAKSDDINNTLVYKGDVNILAPKREIKDLNITITKPTKIALNIKGDAKKAEAIMSADGELYYEKIKIKPRIRDTKVDVDLLTKDVKATLFADIYSSVGRVKSDALVSLNLDDINSSLKYDANLLVKDTKPFKGVDLSSLGTIKAKAKGSLKELDAHVNSPKFKLLAKSGDFDKFDVSVDTKKIEIGKIYRYLPKELQKSFVNVKSHGFYRVSQDEAKFTTKLRGLKYAGKIISTKEFTFYKKGEDIKLDNFALLADGFNLDVDVQKVGDKLRAKIDNDALKGYADVKLSPLFVDAKAHIKSIDKLIKEINKVYPLKVGMKLDGALDLVANMQGEDVKVALVSDKIKFEDGDIVDLNLLAYYNPKRVLLKNFDFELKGFEPKEFNRKVRLKRDGLITLDKKTNTIDIALENLLEFKGTQKGDIATGELTAKDLMIAYKDYGSTKITTKIDMFQSKKQMAVTGFIEFAQTEITYESPFLDVSKDPDIIIITREDKAKKTPNDSFLQDTFLDLDIKSKDEMLYKVDAGEIEFSPDIKIRKDFRYEPKITGKIKVLDGQYDVADKRFQIEEGAIAFRGQEGSNPLLDLHVNYEEIDDVVIMIAIGGDKNRPKLVFSSKPMMSKKDIFSYLLFGMSASETEGAATSANKAAEKIFGRAVAKDLARELNLDRLDMNRNSLGGIDVKAGKKLNRKSILYYQNKSNESSAIYERKLSKKWSVETEVGKQGQGIELFYRKGYK